jgi:hypothetical protein
MKITNRFNLPDAFYNFARNDKYSRGKADISVTTLIDSPRVRLMRDKYNDQLETDASDMIWALFGTAVHHVLESADDPSHVMMEERLYAEVAGGRCPVRSTTKKFFPTAPSRSRTTRLRLRGR